MTMTVSTLAPVGAPRNCPPSGYFTQRGRGIGYSFQLAITAPLYSIISYSIASAQDWKDEWLHPPGAVSAKASSIPGTLVPTPTGKRGICNNMWNALRLPEGHKHWVNTFLLKRNVSETMSSRECKVIRKCIIWYGTTLRWRRHGTRRGNTAPHYLVFVPSNMSSQISCPSLGCKKNSSNSTGYAWTKINKIWQVIINQTIFCIPSFKKITLLYTIVPIGVGGQFFHVILFCSKIGLRDQDFQGK